MTEIHMPQLDSEMTEADLVSWLAVPGDAVSKGEVLLEIETDKSIVEIEAPASGILAEILVPAGSQGISVGTLLGRIAQAGTADTASAATARPNAEATAREHADPEQITTTSPQPAAEVPARPTSPPEQGDPLQPATSAVAATALARRLADRGGIDLASVEGSGARGRVTRSDVERQLGDLAGRASSEPEPVPAKGGSELTRIPHTRMRRTIAERLSAAKQTIPHFYLRVECRLDALLEARHELNRARPDDARVSLNDFVVRAAALALREVPAANASWSDDALLVHQRVDISVAVATEGGLITPIIRDADRKGLSAVSDSMRDLAARARAGRLQPSEYQGGTFSVSNLGMYGIDSVYPIVNPPQSCILGVGAASEQPVVRDGELAIASVMALTLSADHRVVDGAVGARLLAAIKRRLEDPLEMVL